MNKQEAIEQINYMDTLNINDKTACQQVDMVIKNQVLDIIDQIDEPQKPVVPQFVADWYEERKDYFDFNIYGFYKYFYSQGKHEEVKKWIDNAENKAIETLVKMKLYGYEVEKEKLYYVNIPNVYHGDFGYSETHDNYSFYNKSDATKIRFELTESEIKLEHEWAWQFAKEVEDD